MASGEIVLINGARYNTLLLKIQDLEKCFCLKIVNLELKLS